MMSILLEKLHDNKAYSDFRIIDETKAVIYLHKVIMASVPFFDTLFITSIGSPDTKSEMKVDSCQMEAVFMLTKAVYMGDLHVCWPISLYTALVELAFLWDLPSHIKNTLARYIHSNFDQLVQEDPRNILMLLLYFGDYPDTLSFRYSFNNERMKRSISQFLEKDTLSEELAEGLVKTPYLKDFSPVTQLRIFLRCKQYDRIMDLLRSNAITIEEFREVFLKDYDMTSDSLTLRQISLLTTTHNLSLSLSNNPEKRVFVLESLVPFRGKRYRHLGNCSQVTYDRKGISLILSDSARKGDCLSIEDKEYLLESISVNGSSVKSARPIPTVSYTLHLNEGLPEGIRENAPIYRTTAY